MGSSQYSLSPFQQEVLKAFFAREKEFFLSGGAALVGFYLHHRTTSDLDLFTVQEDAYWRSRNILEDIVSRIGATLETKQDTPGFQRHLITRGKESIVLDLILERTVQIHPEKPERDGIPIDPPEEILANKLTSLVSRAEERDLVDVMCLERAGFSVEDAMPDALAKDGGCTPGQLAYVLSEIQIPDGAKLPGGVHAAALRSFLEDLIRRLRRAAMPQ